MNTTPYDPHKAKAVGEIPRRQFPELLPSAREQAQAKPTHFLIVLRVLPNGGDWRDGNYQLKTLLTYALRSCGLRCASLQKYSPPASIPANPQTPSHTKPINK